MSFKEAVRSVFENYATFSGRARRSEYWYFRLFNFIVLFLLGTVPILLGRKFAAVFSGLSSAYSLATLVPMLAVSWRRLHDIGKTGSYFFLFLLPFAGPIILLFWYCTDSDPGDNMYGPNPKAAVGSGYTRTNPSGVSGQNVPDAESALNMISSCLSREWIPVQRKYVVCIFEFRVKDIGLPTKNEVFYLGFDRRAMDSVLLVYPENQDGCYEILLTDAEYDEIAGWSRSLQSSRIWGERTDHFYLNNQVFFAACKSSIPPFQEKAGTVSPRPQPDGINNLLKMFPSHPNWIVEVDGTLASNYFTQDFLPFHDPLLGNFNIHHKNRFLDLYTIDDLYKVQYVLCIKDARIPILVYHSRDGYYISSEFRDILNNNGFSLPSDPDDKILLITGSEFSQHGCSLDYSYESILEQEKEKMEKLAPAWTGAMIMVAGSENTTSSASQAEAPEDSNNPYMSLRATQLGMTPASVNVRLDPGVKYQVYAALADIAGDPGQSMSIALRFDGSSSIYYSSGGGKLALSDSDEKLRSIVREFLLRSCQIVPDMQQTSVFPLPGPNETAVYLKCGEGIFTMTITEEEKRENSNKGYMAYLIGGLLKAYQDAGLIGQN